MAKRGCTSVEVPWSLCNVFYVPVPVLRILSAIDYWRDIRLTGNVGVDGLSLLIKCGRCGTSFTGGIQVLLSSELLSRELSRTLNPKVNSCNT